MQKREQQAAKEEEAVKRIEAAGLKSNRIKGDDSPVPLRCVACVSDLPSVGCCVSLTGLIERCLDGTGCF